MIPRFSDALRMDIVVKRRKIKNGLINGKENLMSVDVKLCKEN